MSDVPPSDPAARARRTRLTTHGRSVDWFGLTPVFADLEPSFLEALARVSMERALEPDEVLFRSGVPAEAIYVVVSGELRASRGSASDAASRLRTGDLVGEAALLTRAARTATVVAVEPSRVLRLDLDELDTLLASDPELRARIRARVSERLPSTRLASLPFFAGVPADQLAALDTDAAHLPLRAGEVLVRQGERADALYLVMQGSFEATVVEAGRKRLVGMMTRGDTIGDVAFLTGEVRAATVRAVRDSVVVRLSHEAVDGLMRQHASVGSSLARSLAHRLRESNRARPIARRLQCLALVGHSCAATDFAEELAAALRRRHEEVVVLDALAMKEFTEALADDSSVATQQVEAWISSLEDDHRFVLLAGGPDADAWTRLAMRRADAVLLVADAAAPPARCDAERAHDRHVARASTSANSALAATVDAQRSELVLFHAPGRAPSGTAGWYADRRLHAHHHVQRTTTGVDAGDLARLARFLRGEAVGVALSGGGARGFSHIGMLRALDEARIPVDVVVGTSMGAVVGAQYALGFSTDRMVRANLAAFPEADVLRDFTVPIVALMKGKSTVEMFKTMYGDARLEDCRVRCCMVSTSLTRSAIVVHDRGPIWLWARSSTSVPGIGPPVIADGELLVDGGVMDNLPVGPLREAGASVLIACDVTSAAPMLPAMGDRAWISGWPLLWRLLRRRGGPSPVPNLLAIMTRASTMASAYRTAGIGAMVDLHLRPPTADVPTMAWRMAADVADIGYEYARPIVTKWASSRAGLPPR